MFWDYGSQIFKLYRIRVCHKEMGLGIDLDTTLDITTLY